MQEAVRELIRPHVDFEIDEIQLLGRGADSVAYLVNGEWVFRIPQNDGARQTLVKEIETLPVLARAVPIRLPEFEYTGEQRSRPLFSGYRVLPGKPLTAAAFDGLPTDAQASVLVNLLNFLNDLHVVPADTVPALKEEALVGAYNSGQRRFHEQLAVVCGRTRS